MSIEKKTSLRPMKVSELMSSHRFKKNIIETNEVLDIPCRFFEEYYDSEIYIIDEENLRELDERFEDKNWVDRKEELVFGLPFDTVKMIIAFLEKNGIDVEDEELEKQLQLKSIVTKFW